MYFFTYFCKLSRREILDYHLLTFGKTKRSGVDASRVSNSGLSLSPGVGRRVRQGQSVEPEGLLVWV